MWANVAKIYIYMLLLNLFLLQVCFQSHICVKCSCLKGLTHQHATEPRVKQTAEANNLCQGFFMIKLFESWFHRRDARKMKPSFLLLTFWNLGYNHAYCRKKWWKNKNIFTILLGVSTQFKNMYRVERETRQGCIFLLSHLKSVVWFGASIDSRGLNTLGTTSKPTALLGWPGTMRSLFIYVLLEFIKASISITLM